MPVRAAIASIEADGTAQGFDVHSLSSTLINEDITNLINSSLDTTFVTIGLTFIILLITFGALVAAIVPLVLAVTALLAAFGIFGVFSQVVAPVSPYATQLIVLIGLAVSVDYSLFMITRFRSERRHGRDKLDAIEIASGTAGRAVFFSGLAVMIALAGLFIIDVSIFRSMAIGTIGVVFVAVVGSLTFLPATLAILGDGVNRGRIPYFGREREEGSGLWARLVGVGHAPARSARPRARSSSCSSSRRRRSTSTSGSRTSPRSPTRSTASRPSRRCTRSGRRARRRTCRSPSPGYDQPATQEAVTKFEAAAGAIPGLSQPTVTPSKDGKVALVSFVDQRLRPERPGEPGDREAGPRDGGPGRVRRSPGRRGVRHRPGRAGPRRHADLRRRDPARCSRSCSGSRSSCC